MTKYRVGILGATGMVGQRFIQLLEQHPQFEITVLGASPKSAGLKYEEACSQWKMDTLMPDNIAQLIVQNCQPEFFIGNVDLVFSGLDSSVAGEVETLFRNADLPVFSNAKNHRMQPEVPLVVPLVNAEHLEMISYQRQKNQLKKGFIVTNANCSTTGLVLALKPLHDAFGITQCHVTTLQAVSGAGYPGIPSLDILSNVVPFIDGEEEKLESEPNKILGSISQNQFQHENIQIDATCNRVPVIDGHTECVSLKFKTKPKSIEHVIEVFENYKPPAELSDLHSMPKQPIYVMKQKDRPQPRLDRMLGQGYSISIGRIRKGNYWDLEFTLLSHNTILGAAGSSILNAEIAIKKNLL